ncbi:MAG: DUF4062 domain-containing protein [Lachnospiraceae bacterium]|nr:DUF4062 domain-containing protein [Lachnospiraceae bacterium]
MEKKYTVFVSSTYQDLKEERKEVMQALLEMDCIPCGMELFPAADDEQFEFIKSVIDECDYYVLILAGRYGSISKSGLSYTELEFKYATEKNIPVISFIREDIFKLPDEKREHDDQIISKLLGFHSLAKNKLCKFWNSKEQLAGLVSRSMIQLIKRHPAIGWVRADTIPSEKSLLKITELYEENRELRTINEKKDSAELNYRLASGEAITNVKYDVYNRGATYSVDSLSVPMSWNDILKLIGPPLIEETIRYSIEKALLISGRDEYISHLENDERINNFKKNQFMEISEASIGEILVQFIALNYIEVRHPMHNNEFDCSNSSKYVLTETGRAVLIQLSAKRIE